MISLRSPDRQRRSPRPELHSAATLILFLYIVQIVEELLRGLIQTWTLK